MCWLCAPFSHICISLEHLHRRMTVALISLVVCVVWRDCCRGFLAWLNACCLLWSRVFDWKSRWEERRIRIEEAAVKPAGGSEGTVWKTGMSRKVWKTKKSRGAVSVRQLVGPGSELCFNSSGEPALWPSEPDCWNWFSRASATCRPPQIVVTCGKGWCSRANGGKWTWKLVVAGWRVRLAPVGQFLSAVSVDLRMIQ